MDPIDAGPSGDRFETFDSNERFVVVRDDEGYAVWRLEDLGEGDPIARFGDDDDGYESAAAMWKELTKAERRQRRSWLGLLWIVILGALLVWVMSSAIVAGISLFGEDTFFPGDPTAGGFARTMYLLSAVSFDGWIAATIAYVVLWLESRRYEQGSVSGTTNPG